MNHSRKKQQIVMSALSACGIAAGFTILAGRLPAAPIKKLAEKPTIKPIEKVKATSASAESAKNAGSQKTLTEDEKIIHVLNRLGFGPRPDDVQKVKAMGLQRYIDQQLAPEQISDAGLDQKLTAYTMLQLSSEQLSEMYQARTVAYNSSRKLRKKLVDKAAQADKQNVDAQNAGTPATVDPNADPAAVKKAAQVKNKAIMAMADPQEREEARMARQELMKAALPVAQAQEQFVAAKVLRAVESERQFQEVLVDFWSNHFNIDIRKQSCGILKITDDREVIRPHVLGKFRDLLEASAKSPAMLVYLDNFQSTSDTPQANVRRPGQARRALLLGAAAGNPGLAGAGQAGVGQTNPAQTIVPAAPVKKKRGGLNENYAREIMELHTLGVDGGYTQKDVTEVARCLTGWSIGRPAPVGVNGAMGMAARIPAGGKYGAAGTFQFHPALHDNGQKIVLGQVIPAGGGIQDGEKVLTILASHPATMRHISTQLCQRLVSDNPPASLIDKCVATWKRTDGDLREVTRTIVTSPEFYAPTAYRSKIKSPFEYAVSSIRALGGTYQNPVAMNNKNNRQGLNIKPPQGGGYMYLDTTSLIGQVGTMGEPLFQYQAPTGYPEESQKWVSSGALISRMNFSLVLTGGKLTDVSLPKLQQTLASTKDPNQFIDRFAGDIMHSNIAPATRTTLLKQVNASSGTEAASADGLTTSRMAALLLGSPEFQRH